ncbi:DEAD-box ATP-dependent RNA helicase [Raphidocelis subcapitata]|uniref:ATP-dependent RNA helicase n=1 Tax=Raphidocelis subcapitata TaxID=307507 RepID=A0A2V0P9E8_9CHLO|nr:DEAD-box ATP-dependent RNA helicase [Raphidocelis subcapitata]|eukprot:GBF94480.1 DEAD-box ATP-dependent RNA helicase [Raphidocelis subcapitata]
MGGEAPAPAAKTKKPKAAAGKAPAAKAPAKRAGKGARAAGGKAHAPGSDAYWSSLQGWRSVDVGEDFLLGAEEGGFAGLEILENPPIFQAPGELWDDDAPSGKKGKKAKGAKQQQQEEGDRGAGPEGGGKPAQRKRGAAAASGGGGDDVDALKARLQALEQENRALKKQRQGAAKQGAAKKEAAGAADGAAAAAAGAEGVEGGSDGEGGGGGAAAPPRSARQERRKAGLEKKRAERKQRLQEKRAAARDEKRQRRDAGAADGAGDGGAAGVAAAAGGGGKKGLQQLQEAALAAAAGKDMSAWLPLCLHPLLEGALALQGFPAPTPVQSAAVPLAVRDRRDIVGAAQTGSGKTLAFGLPIMQLLLEEREAEAAEAAAAGAPASDAAPAARAASDGALRALVLAPTRELALQVCAHLQALGRVAGIGVAPIVGGIAAVKQERLLARRPEVVVATPGRLWDLMSSGHAHLTRLARLRVLVIDEADRMVQQGHYQELSSILDLIPRPSKGAEGAAAAAAAAASDGWADAPLLDEGGNVVVEEGEEEEGEEEQEGEEEEDGEAESEEAEGSGEEEGSEEEEEEAAAAEAAAAAAVARRRAAPRGARGPPLQTMVFSATLTLPASLRKRLRRGGGGSSGAATLEGLMGRVPFRGEPAIVDLTTERKLADRVEEASIECLEDERDAALYYLLARHPGRALVFVNAVSSLRRVAAVLKLLGLPAQALHAQQQQRQRLKALDRFKANEDGVLVATDVAARGLDVKGVQTVVHYQVPASADTYIHRCGRTARGAVGTGVAVSLVSPGEAARWAALLRAMGREEAPPPAFPVDRSLLKQAAKRVSLAEKVDVIERKHRKARAEGAWARVNAEAVGLDLSDDGASDSDGGGGKRGGKKRGGGGGGGGGGEDEREARRLAELHSQLAAALSEPLQARVSTKYFTGGASALAASAAASAAAAAGAGGEDGGGGHALLPADAIAQTVQLAARLHSSRRGDDAGGSEQALRGAAVAAAAGGKKAKAAAAAAAAAASGKKRKAAAQGPDLSRLLMSNNERKRLKRGGGGGGFVVVGSGAPGAFGRDTQGASALSALRQQAMRK